MVKLCYCLFNKMSWMLTFSGNSSVLTTDYFPPIELDRNASYVIGLVDFQTYNSIPNVDESNNKFHYGEDKIIVIPEGAYEIEDLERYISKQLRADNADIVFQLTPNINTLKCEIKCSVPINFIPDDSIGRLLGFNKGSILRPDKSHQSDTSVNIMSVNTIEIDCNIVSGAYINNKANHTIFHFSPNLPPGYKIVIHPSNVIYLPLNIQTIGNITLSIRDQTGKLVNFRGETVTIGLHLKKL